MNNYVTIAPHDYTWEQVIKKSRFIFNIARVNSEEQARDFINRITKTHHKATHNVFAYMIGDRDQIQRYSDNGEPSGTAGVPMLEVLQKNQVHDVVAVVTRYFGGVKLGAGGLIRAYAGTTADGIKAAGLVTRLTRIKVTITVDYKHSDTLNYWLTNQQYHILDIIYDTNVHFIVPIAEENITAVETTLNDLLAGQINIAIGDETFFEIPTK